MDAEGTAQAQPVATDEDASPRKRRKVNHACVYCRRSDRPCARCVKRSIGHLCHDEPREPAKAVKAEQNNGAGEGGAALAQEGGQRNGSLGSSDQQQVDQQLLQGSGPDLSPPALPTPSQADIARPVSSSPVLGAQNQVLGAKSQQSLGYGDWNIGGQSQFHDMHNYHPSYMFNAPEVTNEYNLLNDFLSTSLLDEGSLLSGDDVQGLYFDPSLINSTATSTVRNTEQMQSRHQMSQRPGHPHTPNPQGRMEPGTATKTSTDQASEAYYMTAADPSGSENPEERMNNLLQAKMDAGLLRPFNYVDGWNRLHTYMDQRMQQASRQKIRQQVERFRPEFRNRMARLNDRELVLSEMWFDSSLMEYDRVFASMAVPACAWRRTGEIYRGNREMAELVHVPLEMLRDGKLALHELIVESHLVGYWEHFGRIAFNDSQKGMLTSCTLKNPDINSQHPEIPCCFSFTVRRDIYNIPALIVGNFLPQKPIKP